MNEREIELPEYPKMRYTRNGERFVDGEEFLRSKTGQRLLKRAIRMERAINAKSNSHEQSNSGKDTKIELK